MPLILGQGGGKVKARLPPHSALREGPRRGYNQGMNNIDNAHRELMITEAMTDIGLDTMGNQNAIFDLAADHFGSDDDLSDAIHYYAEGTLPEGDLQPRSIAFLRLLKHIPDECLECDPTDD